MFVRHTDLLNRRALRIAAMSLSDHRFRRILFELTCPFLSFTNSLFNLI
jgi:hypothetical protein